MSNDYTNLSKEFAEGRARQTQAQRAEVEHGSTVGLPLFYRYVIIDTIFDPSIIDDKKLDYWEHTLGVANIKHAAVAPRNSVIARRVKSPSSSPADQPLVLYPMLPPTISLPCKPGEQIWVMFEDPAGTQNDLGYWICRIVGPSFVEDVNHTHAPREYDPSFVPGTKDRFDGNDASKYEFRNGKIGEIDGERYTVGSTATLDGDEDEYKKLMRQSDGGRLESYEPVPRYRKRPGDTALEGTNNTLIVLGRDRAGASATYVDGDNGLIPETPSSDSVGTGTGCIDIVAGRGQTSSTGGTVVDNDLPAQELGKSKKELVEQEGDPDFANDRSRIMISQRVKIDERLELELFNVTNFDDVVDSTNGDGAIVLKSDKIRIIARSDVEIIVPTFTRDAEGKMIQVEDTNKWGALILKSTGDIILRPSEIGFIKLGDEAADKAVLVTDVPASTEGGAVSAPPLISSMGGMLVTGATNQGKYAKKILAT